MNVKKTGILMVHAFIGWALCGATMGIGLAVTTETNAMIIHAAAAPVIFFFISMVYFKKFNFTTPLQTAITFVSFVILVDFLLVALVINRSLEMFASPLGTWIPFLLIFLSTYMTGAVLTKKTRSVTVRP